MARRDRKMFSLNEKMKFFRCYLWNCYSNVYNWKSLVYSIYHIQHLINHFDNYQIKNPLEKQFQYLSDYLILFIKDLITIEIQSKEKNSSNLHFIDQIRNIPSIEQHIENLKTHLNNLRESVLHIKERFSLCQTDLDAIETLIRAIEEIHFDGKTFDKSDLEKIYYLSLKDDLAQKSNRTDLIQLKNYIDNQIKNLIELNKENARELERIKLMKSSTCHAKNIQSILSKPFHSHQSSRPYITFELDHIRKYQRQAFVKSPHGTIPLYRRQAWAAANLFPNHSLHFLRYMQNDLSNICRTNKRKKLTKKSSMEIFHRDNDVLIMGNNNKLYRGRIDSCEIMALKKVEEKKLKTKVNHEEKLDLHFEQFDQSNQNIFDEHLFEYLDWQIQFNEQDLPNELCEELFKHWTSIVCNDQPCQSNSPSKSESIDIPLESKSIDTIYDDRCMCSECSCNCEKYPDEQSICLCPECSCQCLKDFTPEISHDVDTKQEEVVEIIPMDEPAPIKEDEIISCDCFLNRSTDPFPSQTIDMKTVFHSLELDNPIQYRQQILEHISFN